ncbi:MAG: sugar ABC transporter substrate-binding protein [Candidatus Adiutrix sp.]|jgi:ABC-type sugar transport system substrate-binding protein|nr:sugar ABC transporter substrate-binding protein [Candidatus Adiutrix sp.]
MRVSLSLLLAAALVLLAPAGRAAPAAKKKVHLGLAINSIDNEYWRQEAEGGRLFAASLPAGSIVTQILTCDGDDAKQLAGLRAFVAEHNRNAILYVDPSSAANTAAIATLCEEFGVYWTSVWHLAKGLSPMDFRYYVMHQSVDGVKQGYDIAARMFKEFKTPGRGRILAIQGLSSNDSAAERYEGLRKALAEYGGVELLDTAACDWNPRLALEATRAWLDKYQDFDGIWSANDDMALAAVEALKTMGLNRKIKVVGVDGTAAALNAVENGDLVCTAVNNGYLQGGYGAAYAYLAWAGKIDPEKLPRRQRAFYIESELVDRDSLAGYRRKFVHNLPVYDYNDLEFPVGRPMRLRSAR